MTDYEIAVRSLSSRNTHLKLRERCRIALAQLKQHARPLPPDFMAKVQTAIYRRHNAIAYKERHFPGWDNLPEALRKPVEAGYPLSGTGAAELNTMLGLERMAQTAEAELTPEPVPDSSEAEIDQMVQDYLAYRWTLED